MVNWSTPARTSCWATPRARRTSRSGARCTNFAPETSPAGTRTACTKWSAAAAVSSRSPGCAWTSARWSGSWPTWVRWLPRPDRMTAWSSPSRAGTRRACCPRSSPPISDCPGQLSACMRWNTCPGWRPARSTTPPSATWKPRRSFPSLPRNPEGRALRTWHASSRNAWTAPTWKLRTRSSPSTAIPFPT